MFFISWLKTDRENLFVKKKNVNRVKNNPKHVRPNTIYSLGLNKEIVSWKKVNLVVKN